MLVIGDCRQQLRTKNAIFEKKMIKKYPKLSPKFIFLYPAYNLRNNEIGATLGLSQLKSIDYNNKIRVKNDMLTLLWYLLDLLLLH